MGRVFDFIANTADGVYAVDQRQSIVMWNEAATRILGHRPPDVLRKPCYRIIHGRDAEGCTVCRRDCDAIRAARRLDYPLHLDMAVRTRADREIWLNVSTVVVPSRNKHLSVLVHMFREATRDHERLRVFEEFAEVVSGHSASTAPVSTDEDPASDCIRLTPRERAILAQLAAGVSTESIAERLCISPRTVRNHISNILSKLGVHSRLEAVTYSIKNGLV